MKNKKEMNDEPINEEQTKKKPNSKIFIYIIIGVIVLLVIALPTKSMSCNKTGLKIETVREPYQDIEVYYENVPYTITEYYYEDVPYTDRECSKTNLKYVSDWGAISNTCINEICDRHEQYCIRKNFWGNCIEYAERCVHTACTKYRKDCALTIENIDDEGGTWSIEGYSWNRDLNRKENFIKLINVYIRPTKIGVAKWSFVYNAGESMSCWYSTKTIPTKTECENVIKTHSERKSREVIKTRSVRKTRTITKYRDAEQTKDIQESYNKNVNWLFGSC